MIESGTPAGIVVEWVFPTAAALLLVRLATGNGKWVVSIFADDRAALGAWILSRAVYIVLFWCVLGMGYGMTFLADDATLARG